MRLGAGRTSLRDAARSLLPLRGTAKLSDHRRHPNPNLMPFV